MFGLTPVATSSRSASSVVPFSSVRVAPAEGASLTTRLPVRMVAPLSVKAFSIKPAAVASK
jgi:hypothetical protein